jgi:hypothetical protein
MEFRAVETPNHVLHPEFDGNNAEAWLRSSFLCDTQGFTDEVLALIRRAESGEVNPDGTALCWGHNEMDVTFHQDRAVIFHYFLREEAGRELEITIPLSEAAALLVAWQREVLAFEKVKRRRGY